MIRSYITSITCLLLHEICLNILDLFLRLLYSVVTQKQILVLNIRYQGLTIGIEIAYHHTCTRKFLYYRPTFPSTNLTLLVSHKIISTPKLRLLTTIWKYLVTTLLEIANHLTLNEGEFTFIIKTG